MSKATIQITASLAIVLVVTSFQLVRSQNQKDRKVIAPTSIESQVIYEGDVKLDLTGKVELNFIFYEKDEISLQAAPVKGKDISRFEFRRWGGSALSSYKSKPKLKLKFSIPETDAYTFVFDNTNILTEKVIHVKISRRAADASTQALDVTFRTETVNDTSYVELLNKVVHLEPGLYADEIVTSALTVPMESDGNTAIIIGSEKEVSDWMGGLDLSTFPGKDPASAIIGGFVVHARSATDGSEFNWSVMDWEKAQLAINESDYKGLYFSRAVSFETKGFKLQPGETYYLVFENPSRVSAKDVKVIAKGQIIRSRTSPVFKALK